MQPHLDDELEPAPAGRSRRRRRSMPRPGRHARRLRRRRAAADLVARPEARRAPPAPRRRRDGRARADDRRRERHEPRPPTRPSPPPRRRSAELIAATLRAAGVRFAFTVPGESFLAVLDALQAAGIRLVATRHEGAAAFAAEAYGQLTGRPAACLGTRAVGASNLAIGIHTATADSTPMFVARRPGRSRPPGREAFQEVDLVGDDRQPREVGGRARRPATAAATLEAAVRATVEGRPGPALISIPEDVLDLPLPDDTRAPVVRSHPEAPNAATSGRCSHFLAAAERPGDPRRGRRAAGPLTRTTSSGSPSCCTSRSSPPGGAAT